MSYGADIPYLFRHSALFVHRILQGAKPADLPGAARRAWRRKDPERVAEIIRGIGVREKPPMTEIESLVAGFKSDVALAVGQHRRIVGAGNVGNFCKSIDFHRQRYGAKLEGLRHQGFDGAEIDAAAAQIAQLANDTIDKAQRSGVVEFHRR